MASMAGSCAIWRAWRKGSWHLGPVQERDVELWCGSAALIPVQPVVACVRDRADSPYPDSVLPLQLYSEPWPLDGIESMFHAPFLSSGRQLTYVQQRWLEECLGHRTCYNKKNRQRQKRADMLNSGSHAQNERALTS